MECVNKFFREKLQLDAVRRGVGALACSCPTRTGLLRKKSDAMVRHVVELFRSGEILPDGRTNEDEAALIGAGPKPLMNAN